MAKITRATQKVFASNSANVGQFGSAQLGTKLLTKDLTTIQALTAFIDGWDDAVLTGQKLPTLQEMNGLQYLFSSQIAYIMQEGIPEYDSGTTYFTNSICKKSGTVEIYKSLTDSNTGNALSDGTKWALLVNLASVGDMKKDGSVAFTGAVSGVDPTLSTHLSTKNYVDNTYRGLTAQSVNIAKTTNGQADFISAGTGLKARILAATTNLIGNGQYKDKLSKFQLTTDFDTAETAIANRRSTLMYKNWSTTGVFDYTCQRPQWGNTFDVSKNLLMDFSSSLTLDKYGNTVTVLGNPTLSGGKYVGDGTGDGLKCTTITSLGSGTWCLEGKFKFNNTNTSMMLFRSKINFGLILYRNAPNTLGIELSSNGSSPDIASNIQGSKTDWNTSTEYYIKLKFTGSQYIVSWSTDGVNYTDDITITSSAIVANITALLFGIEYDESTRSLNGTMDDLRVTIGNTRADGGVFTPDAYWFDTANKVMKYGSPASWAELPECVALGEVTTNASAVIDYKSYALNGRTKIIGSAVTLSNTYTYTHNIGTENIEYDGYFDNVTGADLAITNGTGGYKIGVGHYNTNYRISDFRDVTSSTIKLVTGDSKLYYGALNASSFTGAIPRIYIKRGDN